MFKFLPLFLFSFVLFSASHFMGSNPCGPRIVSLSKALYSFTLTCSSRPRCIGTGLGGEGKRLVAQRTGDRLIATL